MFHDYRKLSETENGCYIKRIICDLRLFLPVKSKKIGNQQAVTVERFVK